MSTDYLDEYALATEISNTETFELQFLKEAKSQPDWPQWQDEIKEELITLKAAGTQELVDLPKDANIISSKWIFCIKKDTSGNIICYKAHFIVQGFFQVPGIDYFDIFAPIAKLQSIHTILAIAAKEDFELYQIDIKEAYLNSKLTKEEDIYMKQPPEYVEKGTEDKVCYLQKTLYKLKQSGHCQYQKLVNILVHHLGFTYYYVDEAVFY